MAANPFDPSYVGAPFFDIYNDASAALPKGNAPSLPGGACNYVDLSPGANGAKCGCRRFWIRSAVGSPTVDGGDWCMCNHHACFHDEGLRDGPVAESRGLGQENERPWTGREPLSPVVDLTKMPPPIPGTDLPIFPVDPLSFIHNNPEDHAQDYRMPLPTECHPPGSLPDTLAWDTVRSQAHSNTLAPLLSQGLMPSQATSTTSSVRAKYLRPFAGKGLHTLGVAGGPKARSPSQPPRGKLEPAASRSERGARDGSFVFVAQGPNHAATPQAEGDTQTEPRAGVPDTVTREAFKNLSDTVGGHEQRLDRLETVSFSAGGHDECQEKHDHMDLRVTDLESRMEEVEKLNTEHGTMISRMTDKNDDAATTSVASFSTAGTSRPTHSQEIYSQLQSLQAQVDSLQSALPSHAHPWEVEVVFLPFPLKKLWQEFHQFKTEPGASGDDWTELPMTYSTRTMRSQSPFYNAWASDDHDAEWLLPRACGDKSVIDKRLRSRGLIRKVSVKGSDARSVQLAMNMAFGDSWREMELPTCPPSADSRLSQFVGLRSAWVPLRKIHKDSRLRFLSPAELLNPTLWDVQFLNSVMMRSSEPRLFVTHPEAYLQDLEAYEMGWTWQKVREMTRVYPGLTESQEVPEADAREEYWSRNEHMDEVPAAQTAISRRKEWQRTSTSSPSQQHFTRSHSWRSASPGVAGHGQSSILMDRRGSLPPHIRTVSGPLGAPGHPSPALSRRRVVSNGQSRRSSPSVRGTSQFAIMKRRRTRSPSYSRHTPRWTASPTPMPMGIPDRQHVRGTTPFAYATPHSNVPLQEVRPVRAGSAAPIPPEYMAGMDYEPDELFEIEIFESDSEDGSYDDSDNGEIVTHDQADAGRGSQQRQLPEDEPWPGIEDQERMSDGENIDPQEVDRRSVASSQPSEYPSTQRAWPEDGGAGFHIHEDDEP